MNPWEYDFGEYFTIAEYTAESDFERIILPHLGADIAEWDMACVVDFACGHGRMAPFFPARRLVLCDISPAAVDVCLRRYEGRSDIDCVLTSLDTIPVPSGRATAVFSWDAMVHFDYPMLAVYIAEFARIMAPGAKGFIHHSNRGGEVHWMGNPGYRAPTTAQGVADLFTAAGLSVTRQVVIPWGLPDLDCLTVFRK